MSEADATALQITGFLRSGTTLIEKIMHSHPNISIASQPCPHLYYQMRNRFRLETGREAQKYPMGNMVGQDIHELASFTAWLNKALVQERDWQKVLSLQKGYSGAMSNGFGADLSASFFDQPMGTFCNCLLRDWANKNISDVKWLGSKEVWLEEYIPHWLNIGHKVILIVRDPRDVVASIWGANGSEYANGGLPLLHILRQWRKSVAFYLSYLEHTNFSAVRYEDLVTDPKQTTDKIADKLELDPFEDGAIGEALANQDGSNWSGNSSHKVQHSGVSASSIGRFKNALDTQTRAYIEAVCRPELIALDYSDMLEDFSLRRSKQIIFEQTEHSGVRDDLDRADQTDCQHFEVRRLSAWSENWTEPSLFLLPNMQGLLKLRPTCGCAF